MQPAEQIRHDLQGVSHATAERAAVQIPVRTVQIDLTVENSPHPGAQARRLAVEDARVRNHDDVTAQLLTVSAQQIGEMRRAGLLLPLDQQRDRHRRGDAPLRREMRRQPVQVHEHLALVVRRTAPQQLVSAHRRLERRALPQFERVDGLHVVMAVNDDHGSIVTFPGPMRVDRRMARRLPDLHLRKTRLPCPVG